MLPKELGLKLGLKGRGPVEKEYKQMKREEISSLPRALQHHPASLETRLCSEGDAGTQLEQASHARH